MNAQKMHVAVVDDDQDVRQSIEWTLQSVAYEVRTFQTADEFLAQLVPTETFTVLIDLLLPGMTGLGLCREIVTKKIPCTFAVITGHADVPSVVEVMKLGAIDLLEKPFTRQRLLEVVNKAVEVAQRKFKSQWEESEVLRQLQTLSPREREIFEAVAGGLVTKEIARQLNISARTVDVHRSRIMQKLGIESPLQLARVLAIAQRNSA